MKRKRNNTNLPEFLQPLPTIENVFPDSWQKGIRSEISRYIEFYSRSKNKRFGRNPTMLGYEKSMEKRRIQAFLKSIDDLKLSPELTREWITLNVTLHSYKDKMSFEKADQIVMEGMGTQFDSRLKECYQKARPKFEAYYSALS